MKKNIYSASLITAIKTPYNYNGTIDLNTYDFLITEQIKHGVNGLVVCGTTGEGHLLDWKEHLMLIQHTINKFSDKLIIIGNTGSNNTKEALKATKLCFEYGMDASLQINPYYGKTSEDGLIEHFKRLLNLGPTIIYNVPSRTGQDLKPPLLENLKKFGNLVGIKECAGNKRINYLEKLDIACWSGNDDESFEAKHFNNSHGVISVTSNLVPSLMRNLMDTKDENLNNKLKPLFNWLFHVPNPNPLNTVLSMIGAVKPVFRLPYFQVDIEERRKIIKILQNFPNKELIKSKKILLMVDNEFKHIC